LRSRKIYTLWSMVIPIIAIATAIALTVIVVAAVDQLKSSVNAHEESGYYTGVAALTLLVSDSYAGTQLTSLIMCRTRIWVTASMLTVSLFCWRQGRFGEETEGPERGRRSG
jgi:hypothetical protein